MYVARSTIRRRRISGHELSVRTTVMVHSAEPVLLPDRSCSFPATFPVRRRRDSRVSARNLASQLALGTFTAASQPPETRNTPKISLFTGILLVRLVRANLRTPPRTSRVSESVSDAPEIAAAWRSFDHKEVTCSGLIWNSPPFRPASLRRSSPLFSFMRFRRQRNEAAAGDINLVRLVSHRRTRVRW
jgi:hypothetical protein